MATCVAGATTVLESSRLDSCNKREEFHRSLHGDSIDTSSFSPEVGLLQVDVLSAYMTAAVEIAELQESVPHEIVAPAHSMEKDQTVNNPAARAVSAHDSQGIPEIPQADLKPFISENASDVADIPEVYLKPSVSDCVSEATGMSEADIKQSDYAQTALQVSPVRQVPVESICIPDTTGENLKEVEDSESEKLSSAISNPFAVVDSNVVVLPEDHCVEGVPITQDSEMVGEHKSMPPPAIFDRNGANTKDFDGECGVGESSVLREEIKELEVVMIDEEKLELDVEFELPESALGKDSSSNIIEFQDDAGVEVREEALVAEKKDCREKDVTALESEILARDTRTDHPVTESTVNLTTSLDVVAASYPFQFTGINHIAYCCKSLERSLEFYCGVLGLKMNLARPELPYRGAWLLLGAEGIHIMEVPNPDPVTHRPAHGGYDRHVCLNCTNVDQLRITLEKAGIPYQHSVVPSIFCRDPDGNGVEIFEVGAPHVD